MISYPELHFELFSNAPFNSHTTWVMARWLMDGDQPHPPNRDWACQPKPIYTPCLVCHARFVRHPSANGTPIAKDKSDRSGQAHEKASLGKSRNFLYYGWEDDMLFLSKLCLL